MKPLVAIVTAGGTREPIDAVRHVTNVATGSLPAAMADVLLARGAEVHYLHGPDAIVPGRARALLDLTTLDAAQLDEKLTEFGDIARAWHRALHAGRLHLHPIGSAHDAAATLAALARDLQPDLVACAMAVADYAPVPAEGKLSSQRGELVVRMRPTPKAIDGVKPAAPHCTLLGFKLLAGASEAELRDAARKLAQRSGADAVFANDIEDHRAGRRRGLLVAPDGQVRARLDGGTGEVGLRNLAEQLVDAVMR